MEANDLSIVFQSKISIAYLDIEKMELSRIDKVDKNHFIYNHIKAPFDWYFHDSIMIIPDPKPAPRKNWNKTITVDGQIIECMGQYVVFYHYEQIGDLYNIASSLTLPEFDYIKSELKIC